MERITVRTKNGDAIVPYSSENSISFIGGAITGYRGKAIDRLAEYEDEEERTKTTCEMVLEPPERPFDSDYDKRYFVCSSCRRMLQASLVEVKSGSYQYCPLCGKRISSFEVEYE